MVWSIQTAATPRLHRHPRLTRPSPKTARLALAPLTKPSTSRTSQQMHRPLSKTNEDVPFEHQMLHILRNYQRLQEENRSLTDENRTLLFQNSMLKAALAAKREKETERNELLAKIDNQKTRISEFEACIEKYKRKLDKLRQPIEEQTKSLQSRISNLERANHALEERIRAYKQKHKILSTADNIV